MYDDCDVTSTDTRLTKEYTAALCYTSSVEFKYLSLGGITVDYRGYYRVPG